MASSPVLDLGSLDPERPYISIDGSDYRMKVPMDMDLVTLSRLVNIDKRLDRKKKGPYSVKLAAEFSKALDEGVKHIMYDPIPADVMGKLNDVAKLAIIDAFPRAITRAGSPPNRKARRARSTSRASSPA